MNNNPITTNDVLGLKGEDWVKREGSKTWEYDSGVQSEQFAKFRYGEKTEYMDDEGTYPGVYGGTDVGTVTVHSGGLQTWDGGTYKSTDINPYPNINNSALSDNTKYSPNKLIPSSSAYNAYRCRAASTNLFLEDLIGTPYTFLRDGISGTGQAFYSFVYGDMTESLHAFPIVALTLYTGGGAGAIESNVVKSTLVKEAVYVGSEYIDDGVRMVTQDFSFTVSKIHGNSLSSPKPTWGYKLYNVDGTFLKNGITSMTKAESRYTKAFMSDKYMDLIPFPNRLGAYQWEFHKDH